MISLEILRRYPFFALFSEDQLTQIAYISEQRMALKGTTLFEERQSATHLFLLIEGSVDLFYTSEEKYHPRNKKEFLVGEINPGEIFGISALIEPNILSASGRVAEDANFLAIDAIKLKKLLNADHTMGYIAMQQLVKVITERLAFTRIQLAAAWADIIGGLDDPSKIN